MLLGFTEDEVKAKLNDIIEFSELGDFIYSPVKTYSSGMYSKLAFSITAILETDIMLIDEVLSVGDIQFKAKSYAKMKELINDTNRTVVIVSHSTGTLRELCDEVGVDAARYFFVSRANSAHLDFDFDLAKKESSENPVYYAQYAHARLSQVLNTASDIKLDIEGTNLKAPSEIALLKADLSSSKELVLDDYTESNKDTNLEVRKIVYDGMTLKELGEKLDRSMGSSLDGYGEYFASYALEKGVDPYLALGIVLLETGCKWGCSYY